MPVDVLVGLQYGSEGKGKISNYLADEYDISVRVGAWQAGHTMEYKKQYYKMQTIPCQWTNLDAKMIIGAGGMIRPDILVREIEMIEAAGVEIRDRLYIDERVVIGNHDHALRESNGKMFEKIGSTQEGIGACLVDKIERKGNVQQAKQIKEELSQYATVTDTIALLDRALRISKRRVFIEGTQGCHLSVTTSKYYPKCTSRDCNVSGILSDCGLSSRYLRDTIGVLRTYPIRVAGDSGDTGGSEITWDEVTRRSGSKVPLTEQTTVTNRTRRVFDFSVEDVQEACRINSPTYLAVMFADYLNVIDHGCDDLEGLTYNTRNWIEQLSDCTDIPVGLISTGKSLECMIDERYGLPSVCKRC